MKVFKIIFIGTLLTVFVTYAVFADEAPVSPAKPDKTYRVVPVDFSIFPLIGTDGFLNKDVIDLTAFNICAGYSAKLTGFGVGIFNIAGEEVYGVQAGAALNYSGGPVGGVQFSGAGNISMGDAAAAQFAGAFNYAGLLSGAQFAGAFNYASGVKGGQFGSINFSYGKAWYQAGTVNLAGSVEGAQAGVINGAYGGVTGAQIGVINSAGEGIDGLQLGVINYSGDTGGLPVGVISIVKNGMVHGEVFYDESGFLNGSLKHGNDYFYNIYTAAINPDGVYHAGLGYGSRIDFSAFYICFEGICSSVLFIDHSLVKYPSLLARIRAYAGFKILDHFSAIAGISFNYLNTYGNSRNVESFYHYDFKAGGKNEFYWPGFFAGIEF